MIRYALVCDNGHGFDSWFRASDDFETQRTSALIGCPVCGSTGIDKQVMAPQIARTDRAEPTEPPDRPPALIDEGATEMRQQLARLRRYLDQNSENVGPRFADEARRMHLGEVKERTIHGQASPAEAKALIEEGIGVLPLPGLPDECN